MQEILKLVQESKFPEAIEGCNKLIEANDKNFQAFCFRGIAQLQSGQLKDAEESLDKALELKADYPQAIQCKAMVFQHKGAAHKQLNQLEEALACFEQALALNPEINAMMNKASLLDDLKRYEEANLAYEQCIKQNPNEPKLWYNRGITQQNLKLYKEALISYKEAIKLNPQHIEAHINEGIAYDFLHEYENAIQSYDKVLDLDPNRIAAVFNKGNALKQVNRSKDALACFDQAIVLDGSKPEAYFGRGIALDDLKEYVEALKAFEKAISLNKSDAAAHFNKGNCLKNMGKFKEAVAAYDEALKLKADYIEAINNKGIVLQSLKMYKEAIECCNDFIKLQPGNADAHNNKGNALKNLKKYDEAIDEFNIAIKINPKYILGYTNRAQTNLLNGKNKEAIEDLHHVAELVQTPKNTEGLSESNVEFIKKSTGSVIELEKKFNEQQKKIEEHLEDLPEEQKEVIQKQLIEIQSQKDKSNEQVLESIQNKNEQQEKTPSTAGSEAPKKNLSTADIMAQVDALLQQAMNYKLDNMKIKEDRKKIELKLEEQKQEVVKIEDTMKVAGVYDQAKIKGTFAKYLKEDKDLYDYAKAFYWTMLTQLDTYRIASTGVLQINLDDERLTTSKESIGVQAASAVLQLGSSLPIVGGLFSIFDSAIDAIYTKVKSKRFEDRTNAIVSIIMKNNDPKAQMKEEQSMMLAKAALEIAERKRDVFREKRTLKNYVVVGQKSVMSRAIDFIKAKVEQIQTAALGQKIDYYSSIGGEEACADSIICLAYMYAHHQEIIDSSTPLDVQLADMVASTKVMSILENPDNQFEEVNNEKEKLKDNEIKKGAEQVKEQEGKKKPTPVENTDSQKSGCCIIM